MDRELGEYVFRCDGGEVRLLLRPQGRDPERKCLRWKVRQDGRLMGVMESHDQRRRYFYLRRHSAESQESDFLDEKPADHRRPQRDAQQPLDNAVPPKSERKAKVTYTQCLL